MRGGTPYTTYGRYPPMSAWSGLPPFPDMAASTARSSTWTARRAISAVLRAPSARAMAWATRSSVTSPPPSASTRGARGNRPRWGRQDSNLYVRFWRPTRDRLRAHPPSRTTGRGDRLGIEPLRGSTSVESIHKPYRCGTRTRTAPRSWSGGSWLPPNEPELWSGVPDLAPGAIPPVTAGSSALRLEVGRSVDGAGVSYRRVGVTDDRVATVRHGPSGGPSEQPGA